VKDRCCLGPFSVGGTARIVYRKRVQTEEFLALYSGDPHILASHIPSIIVSSSSDLTAVKIKLQVLQEVCF
jgi:hypothetical protein